MLARPKPRGSTRAPGTVLVRLLRAGCAVATGCVVASGAAGQTGAGPDGPDRPAAVRDTVSDPEAVVDEARDRQRDFERHRRLRLPHGGGMGPDRCDEIVGRYCLWHGDGRGDVDDPPEESRSVRSARAELLDHLERALDAVPGSAWLAGQRVRYLLEAGRADEALAAARSECRAAVWWCRALEGRVLHDQARFVEAGEVFASALEAMEPERWRTWTDVGLLLEGDAEDRWEEAEPDGRRRLARRMWRLADPLYLVPGNDRRSEHLSRVVATRVRRDGATPFGRFWNDGLEELTLRYGLPVDYRREAPSPARMPSRPLVMGRHPPSALAFLPSAEVLLRPGRADRESWDLDAPRPQTSYAPPYADTVTRLQHRLSVFPRGDSSVVVAAYRSRAGGDGEGTEALLRLIPIEGLDARSLPGAAERRAEAPGGGLAVRVPARPHLVSVEVLHRDSAAERARYTARLRRRPEGVPGLSDVLVLDPGGARPASVEEAVGRVRAPAPVRPGARLELYWELYGPRLLLDDVEVSVALAEEGGGLIERLAGAVGLGDEDGVALGWRDAAGRPGRVHPRGVELRLPDDLDAGSYRLEVSVRVPGHDPMRSLRRLEVADADTE